MSTGKIIKTLRCKHGLTQDELATILEVKKSRHHQLLLSDLNDEGRKKVFEYAKDLKDSKNYSS